MRVLLLSLLITISSLCHSQGIEFFHGDWKEALALAKKEEKALFVDAYTTWCGPCKRMAKNVFTQDKVGEYFNANFINIKIDMESEMGMDFGAKYPVSGYPTLLFLDGDGEEVHKSMGGKNDADFIKLGEFVMRKNDQSGKYAEKYEAGDRDFELVYKYVKALNTAGKPSLKVSNDYLRSKPVVTDEQMAMFLLEATVDSDSRMYKKLIENKKSVIKYQGEEELKKKVAQACLNTISKAIEYDSEDLYKEARDNYKKFDKKGSKRFNAEADMKYFVGMKESEKYFEVLEEYCSKYIKNDAAALNAETKKILTAHRKNQEALEIACKAIKRATELETDAEYWLNYSQILSMQKKHKEAVEAAKKAIEIAKEKKQSTRKMEGYLKMLERNV